MAKASRSCMDLSPTARIFWLGTGSGHVYVLCWALAFRCLPWIMMVSRLAGGDDHCDVVEANNDVSFLHAVLDQFHSFLAIVRCLARGRYRCVPRRCPVRRMKEPCWSLFPGATLARSSGPVGGGGSGEKAGGKGGPFFLVSLSLSPLSARGCLHEGAHAGSSRWRGS